MSNYRSALALYRNHRNLRLRNWVNELCLNRIECEPVKPVNLQRLEIGDILHDTPAIIDDGEPYPLPYEEMIDMYLAITQRLISPCDNTLRHTRQWLREQGYGTSRVVRWLKWRNGYCDCEVLKETIPPISAGLYDELVDELLVEMGFEPLLPVRRPEAHRLILEQHLF